MKPIILIDNGHGKDTPGKCSPVMEDGSRYYEYAQARIIARRIVSELCARGYDAQLLVPEVNDVPLKSRVERANKMAKERGMDNVFVVSIHSNAAGNGGWMQSRGWSVWTSPGRTNSDQIATCIFNRVEEELQRARYSDTFTQEDYAKRQRPMRSDFSDGDCDYEAKFYILTKTSCPAVLSENLFHDNKADVKFLLSEAGTNAIVQGHVSGIIDYIKQHYK